MSHYSDAEDSIGESAESEGLRKRKVWDLENESLTSEIKELLDDDVNSLVEEDCVGCPLPSTPEDEAVLDSEMSEVLKAAVLGDELDITALAHNAASQAEHVVRKMIQAGWSVCHFRNLPAWLQDNDFLIFGHRPPLPSFRACFKSIFRIHTETANIWTHLLGCVAFIGLATYFLQSPPIQVEFQEKLVFCFFFCGAILCLGLSTLFHTVSCHSKNILNVFSKLDYCGISLLIMGSIVPWLYYSFYCHFRPKLVYTIVTCAMGVATMVVSLWDEFSKSERRHIRAGLFLLFGLSGVVPAIHFGMLEGWFTNIFQKSIASMILMGLCYIAGTMLYALRVPERFYPGKFDIWLHSHQIFHVFVLGGAYFHYQGLMEIARDRLEIAQCEIS
ncbi:adiponectin receptor protein isoform X7 [Harmonia axyridis]|uniref:adiponectin receptor protein isoform X7 n=1 Tax=Harmonia axyridis TaxID=115357 RepID=UPI001E278BF7|nr:adiponectin receptor protein isoform X7 [Harmonia axyridis]XP_045469170.1 adiponectin receptor protein isoform X7 [Harmonia axyridis]